LKLRTIAAQIAIITSATTAAFAAAPALHPPIPIRFTLSKPGYVTLVINDLHGRRVRNLVSDTLFPAGNDVAWWDGLDDTGRVKTAPNDNFGIAGKLVAPDRYQVEGLEHPKIDLRYQFTVYNPGQPPWATKSPSSEWLANHTPPSDVLFVPPADAERSPAPSPTGGEVLVASAVTEGGSGLAWLDLNGRKLRGQMWLGGVWTGATALARDAGSKRAPGVYAYAAEAWPGDPYDGNLPELRIAELLMRADTQRAPRDSRMGRGDDRPLLTPNKPYPGILPPGQTRLQTPAQSNRYVFPDKDHTALGGLAVYNGLMAASLPKMNQLLWIDAVGRKILGTTPLDDPRGLAFDTNGRLLALSGHRLISFTPGADPFRSHTPKILISSGLDDPNSITVAPNGDILISDRGKSNQVKLFSPSGKLVRAIGKPGLPQLGPYDPLRMRQPGGITLDSENRIWVAETDFVPKRVSIWTLDGKLVKAFYGPMEYGGGGSLDPHDKSRYYYSGMEFKINWKDGANSPSDNYYQSQYDPLKLPADFKSRAPETALYDNGRRYLTDCYNVSPTNAAGAASIWIMKSGVARPAAALGDVSGWSLISGAGPGKVSPAFQSRLPAGVKAGDPLMFAWSDLNDDGKVEPGEVVFLKAKASGITVMPDLSFVAAYVDGRAVKYAPTGFDRDGIPRYDLTSGVTIATDTRLPETSGGGQAIVSRDGWTILTVPPAPYARQASMAGVKNGQPLWSYPSLWPGLHPSHDAPMPDHPGELIGTTRLLGGFVIPRGSDAGPIWAINGNKGNVYLFTEDGLFVSTLFKDCRTASWDAPTAVRGMLVNNLSLQEENFWPSITQTSDGDIYVSGGGDGGNIIEVDGLSGIRRLPAQIITVTTNELSAAQSYFTKQEAARQTEGGSQELTVDLRKAPPVVDGKLDDWPPAAFVPIDNRASAAIAIAGDRLYAAFKTGDDHLLDNAGNSLPNLFKTGGALDLMIDAIPGGERLLVTRVDGKTTAVLYRPHVPGSTSPPVTFSSPQRTLKFDRVDDVSHDVQLAGAGGNYEFSIPLAPLGLKPAAGATLRGDVGILRGNGFQTLQRVYWRNKATGLVSDTPGEAELTPELWGRWVFRERG